MQKTVYLFLPGVQSIDNEEISNIVRHETIHGLTGTNNLSDIGETSAAPNPDEQAKWNAVCTDMRDFSLQDAEEHKQSSIESLDELRNQFHNSDATEIINEIINALQDGTFDRYQPEKPDNNPNDILIGKVPDCMTIGPWEVLVRLMNDKGLGLLLNKVITSNQTIGNIILELQTNWDSMIANQTIYRIFREGTYEQDSPEKLLGHEYEDWDELITSTSDVCIAYPEKVAAMIERLPPDRRAVALQLVHLSLTTLNETVPPDQNEDFHKLIFGKLSTIVSIVAQQENIPASK